MVSNSVWKQFGSDLVLFRFLVSSHTDPVSFCPRVSSSCCCPGSSVRMIDGYWCTYADCQHCKQSPKFALGFKDFKKQNSFSNFACVCVPLSIGQVSTLWVMNLPPTSSVHICAALTDLICQKILTDFLFIFHPGQCLIVLNAFDRNG